MNSQNKLSPNIKLYADIEDFDVDFKFNLSTAETKKVETYCKRVKSSAISLF